MGMNEADTLELLSRFDSLVKKYVPLAAELAPKIEKFGKYRRELQAITVELKNRGVEPQDNEELSQIIKDEIEKRGKEVDERHDSSKGSGTSVENPGQADQ